ARGNTVGYTNVALWPVHGVATWDRPMLFLFLSFLEERFRCFCLVPRFGLGSLLECQVDVMRRHGHGLAFQQLAQGQQLNPWELLSAETCCPETCRGGFFFHVLG